MFELTLYYTVLLAMAVLAVVVFVALQYVEAPYGIAFRKGWGPSVDNKLGWIAMEAPALGCMIWMLCWSKGGGNWQAAPVVMAALFIGHYAQRTLLFPLLMRGKSRMPWAVAAMGAVFNTINAYLIGEWLLVLGPKTGLYQLNWLWSWQFICGSLLFLTGMAINLHSDYIIRHLRKPGETGHKIPHGGMYNYVASANYLGEIIEWGGYALLTCSAAGVVFLLWTAANLVPRSAKIHQRYLREFGNDYARLNRKRVFPFLY